MEQVTLEVPDLETAQCERVVTAALIGVPGVRWATAAADPGVVAARYDPAEAVLEDLRQAVEAAGFARVPATAE